MPFIPHTEQDIKEMLHTLNLKNTEQLFSEIPKNLRIKHYRNFLKPLSEMQVTRLMKARAKKDKAGLCFIGAGAYEHYIPAPVWDLTARGEFMTAYTPYQAEASQGTLQTIYEYQTMIANLTGMDVSNASLYDGASAVGEATLMAVRANRNSETKKILVAQTLHPNYRKVAKTIATPQDVEFFNIPYNKKTGTTSLKELNKFRNEDITAVVIQQPNFFGGIEDVDKITDWAHEHNALVIAVVNPIAITLLKDPGSWGEKGADIVIGDGQPLGCPLASGGPYFGFMSCKKEHFRTMPGRIIGKTTDTEGKPGYVLNLQAREQHIRRAKATSNICTNQGLMATAATIHMSLLGAEGLYNTAIKCHQNSQKLKQLLTKSRKIKTLFAGPTFHEFVISTQYPTHTLLSALNKHGIQGGFDLNHDYPELGNALLICATETKTDDDLKAYVEAMQKVEEEL